MAAMITFFHARSVSQPGQIFPCHNDLTLREGCCLRCVYGYDMITFRLSPRHDRIALGSKARVRVRAEPTAVAPARPSHARSASCETGEEPGELRSIARKLLSRHAGGPATRLKIACRLLQHSADGYLGRLNPSRRERSSYPGCSAPAWHDVKVRSEGLSPSRQPARTE
jgi:hypothetical protein